MSKILGSWSGMRKYLEQEMLADSLRGRVRYNLTSFKGMDGFGFFELYIDGEQTKCFSLETVNSYFIKNKFKSIDNPSGYFDYWSEFWPLLDKYPVTERTEYTDEEFCNALEHYRNQDIQDSLYSNNPIIRMFAIFDRRVGKRTLNKLKSELNKQPEWLQSIYLIRFDAE